MFCFARVRATRVCERTAVGTVFKMQGSERHFVLLSFVRSVAEGRAKRCVPSMMNFAASLYFNTIAILHTDCNLSIQPWITAFVFFLTSSSRVCIGDPLSHM